MSARLRRVRARKRIADAVDGALYDLEREARDGWAQADRLKAEIDRLRELIADREGRIDAARQTFEQLLLHGGWGQMQKTAIDNILPMLTPVEPK